MTRLALLAGVLALAGTSLAQNTCSSTIAAASCGPTLTVTFTPIGTAGNQTIELVCNGLDPTGIGLMSWGQNQINVPLINCPMLNDFVWGHFVNLDATGSYTWSRTWPGYVTGYFYMQFASITFPANGGFVVMSTDSMRAECI
jgi:hypothetical protein